MNEITDKIYDKIIPEIKNWPISQYSQEINSYKKEIVEIVYNELLEKYGDRLKNEIASCAYSELNRIKNSQWKVDPPEEKNFWTSIRKDVLTEDIDNEHVKFILKRIINRYIEEIIGHFNIKTFQFARIFLLYFFNRIFSGFWHGNILNPSKGKYLAKRLKLTGKVDEVRELFSKGLVVMLPTHQSNLDSILVGYTLDFKMGLPAFAYGAGLNLFNYEIPAYYMDRLGAYKVDRRKKNGIYLASLLTYSKFSLEKNVNSIFFPGGTRSRSGKIETELKTGLMSSMISAQYEKLANGDNKKIFVVPVIMNYNSVLEARSLIYSYLKTEGKTKYISIAKWKDKKFSYRWLIRTLYRIVTKKSDFILSIGQPMDVFGNKVDSKAQSVDIHNNIINIEDYFKLEGTLVNDPQRISVYTKMLSKNIANTYLRFNTVMASHLVAYVAFKCLEEQLNFSDVFDLFKYKEKEIKIKRDNFNVKITYYLEILKKMEKNDEIILEDILHQCIDDIIYNGIKNIGIFHVFKVLYFKKEYIMTEDFGLLYYYSNRLSFLDDKI